MSNVPGNSIRLRCSTAAATGTWALRAGRQTVTVRDPRRRARWVRIGGAGQSKAVRVRIRG
jgi:hypothetical protein